MKNHGEELGWELDVDFPSWANTEIYVKTISKGYLLEGETPKDAYWRVATKVARRLERSDMASKFFDYIWRGWLNLATPVLSNTGTDRGLPISCFGVDVGDSIQEIGNKNLEMMLLAKSGGGVASCQSRIERPVVCCTSQARCTRARLLRSRPAAVTGSTADTRSGRVIVSALALILAGVGGISASPSVRAEK